MRGEAGADIAFAEAMNGGDLRVALAFEREQDERAVERLQFANGAVKTRQQRILAGLLHDVQAFELALAPAPPRLASPPCQCAIVGDAEDEGRRRAFAAKRRRGAPHRQHQFLQQVVPVGAGGKSAGDAMQHTQVLAHPCLEPLLAHAPLLVCILDGGRRRFLTLAIGTCAANGQRRPAGRRGAGRSRCQMECLVFR